jgi:hypothetical protein
VFTALAVIHLNLPSEPVLDLNCLVLGDDISAAHVFSVKVAKSETVGGLKKAIKNQKKVELVLWKVSN